MVGEREKSGMTQDFWPEQYGWSCHLTDEENNVRKRYVREKQEFCSSHVKFEKLIRHTSRQVE